VAGAVLIGLATDGLSQIYEFTSVVLLAILVVGAALTVGAEPFGWAVAGKPGSQRRSDLDLAKFVLLSAVVGAVVGLAWLIPWGETVRYSWTTREFGVQWFSNYELFAAATIAGVGSLAAFRGTKLDRVAVFVVSASLGMSLTIYSVHPEHDVLRTLATWAFLAFVVCLVAATLPDAARLMADFVGGRGSTEVSPSAEVSRRPSGATVAGETVDSESAGR
jgi:hypothetical protein